MGLFSIAIVPSSLAGNVPKLGEQYKLPRQEVLIHRSSLFVYPKIEQLDLRTNNIFTITAEILARSLAKFLLSISGLTHEILIYAMRQRARADNLTICYRKKQIDVSF